jgi:hypothetical protein
LSLLQLQDQPEEAIRGLARAAELAGSQPDAPRVRLMQALVERGRFDEAAGPIRALLARNPGHVAARVESARVHLARNELDSAAAALEPCLTNAHTMRPATLLLSQVRLRQGDPVAAAELSRRAARMPRPFDWPDPYFREVQGLRADQAGDYPLACRCAAATRRARRGGRLSARVRARTTPACAATLRSRSPADTARRASRS